MVHTTELNKVIKDKLQDIELALNESSIVAITDTRGFIQFANEKFCEISKYSREELIGSNQNIVNSGYHSNAFFKNMWKTIGTGNVWKGEVKNKAKDGTFYWVDTTIVPFLKENGKPYQYISIRHDITKLKEYEKTISQMAYNDPLTLLPNRNYLNEWINNWVPQNDETVTVLFVDVDRFKAINDTFGHRVGDMVLEEVARRLKASLCSSHVVIRQGGDEFIIFLKDLKNKSEVIAIVHDIMKQFTLPFMLERERSYITISIGISMEHFTNAQKNDAQTIDRLIRQADTAMYHAKKKIGNSYCFNTNDQNNQQNRYYLLEHELKEALQNDEFTIAYQPIMNLKNNQIAGVEALLRWDNTNVGAISPAEFIPLLEELGWISSVGKWVLTTVCYQMKAWQEQGFQIPRVAVNVSPLQFRNHDFVKDVKNILRETGLEPKYLELEITEGTILHLGKSEEILKELREIGVSLSIDDFGTGYSSLIRLKRLPINTLKIDKSFIDDLDMNGEVIVDTIISMGKTLNFNIVAEGIEKDEQLAYLKKVECHEGQGYYWSKPISAKEIENDLLAKYKKISDKTSLPE